MITSKSGINALKFIHFFFAFLWIGGAIAVSIILFASKPVGISEWYMKFRIMQIIDDMIIIPGALGSFVIGLIYGLTTKWGFFKHNWISVKWILTVLQILFGTFFLGPWLNNNVDMLKELGEQALNNETLLHNAKMTGIWGTTQASVLLFTVYISITKPFKRKKENNVQVLA